MMRQKVTLADGAGRVWANAEVAETEGRWEGAIELDQAPLTIHKLFAEYEEIVGGQMFSFLDAIEDRIAALGTTVRFDDGAHSPIHELQIFPTESSVMFRLAKAPSPQLALR